MLRGRRRRGPGWFLTLADALQAEYHVPLIKATGGVRWKRGKRARVWGYSVAAATALWPVMRERHDAAPEGPDRAGRAYLDAAVAKRQELERTHRIVEES